MKKLLMVVALSMVSVFAMADEPFVFKPIKVEDTEGNSAFKINASDVKKGVYIHARGGWSSTFPKTAEVIKAVFRAKGVKVVDNVEDADYGVMVAGGNRFGTFASVEEDVGSMSNTERAGRDLLFNVGFTLVTSTLTPGEATVFSADRDGLANIQFIIMKNPHQASRGRISGDDTEMFLTLLTFRLNRRWTKEDHFGARVVAEITNGFIDQHFTGLPAPVATPASGVAPALPVAASAPAAAN